MGAHPVASEYYQIHLTLNKKLQLRLPWKSKIFWLPYDKLYSSFSNSYVTARKRTNFAIVSKVLLELILLIYKGWNATSRVELLSASPSFFIKCLVHFKKDQFCQASQLLDIFFSILKWNKLKEGMGSLTKSNQF